MMPWKNGQGVTSEMWREPSAAGVPHAEFIWRLSSAPVKTPGAFSRYPGYNRILAVWEGQGLKLNGILLEPWQPHYFSGDVALACEPCGDEVLDIGIIYRRDVLRASLVVLDRLGLQNLGRGSCAPSWCLIVNAAGSLHVNDIALERGDSLLIEGSIDLQTHAAQPAIIFCFRLFDLTT
jgi:environmental stress-induced protein Ves